MKKYLLEEKEKGKWVPVLLPAGKALPFDACIVVLGKRGQNAKLSDYLYDNVSYLVPPDHFRWRALK